ncbi:dynamin family protein [Colletotrichum orchidophilum]|uniref:Dynamin family protein n=1 Tax=Colletotrichum orchidophilum TaxID=1209926 RepID=A0A1G4B6B9_9PEZI|nr:dynamin family protein [Colletotrichum orchidophilum]OHE96944.1 dynamin family protein [Colletotrichum orchidophilum]
MALSTVDSSALGELNSSEAKTLFDTTDKLSLLGIGRIVNLPQIIVVGDQSSGKSSVLEAISHVHFPVQEGLCTRFATELILRPGSRRFVTATVQFADGAKPVRKLQVADFNQEDIDHIVSTAKIHMGLHDAGRDFSKDVLRLEIEGPDMYPLTLVDLPGIFHSATANQSPEGIAIVMDLVGSYMKKKNSIILAVVSASNQLANQAVMREAMKHDPTKERTLGVLTKPDLLHPGSSSENEYLQLVTGHEVVHKLGLGWHVLRNQADHEKGAGTGTRDEVEEQFFNSGAWASVPAVNRGVVAFRKKLSQILLSHMKQSLPKVIDDIHDKLKEREGELSRLGRPRSTPADMRAYLVDIAGSFQRLVCDGIEGHYNHPFFGGYDGTHRKIRAQLRNFNRAVRQVLLAHGSAQSIIQLGGVVPQPHDVPQYLKAFISAHQYDFPDPEIITRTALAAQLERQAAANQGTEFPGYANMDLVIQLFQKQANPWGSIAEQHLANVTLAVKGFVDEVFEYTIGPINTNTTTEAVLTTFADGFFDEKEGTLAAKLQEILRPFKEGYAMPLDDEIQEAIERRSTAERKASQQHGLVLTAPLLFPPPIVEPQSSKEFGIDRIIDTMQAFYDISLRTFTDNLINLAIETCLIRDLPNILTPRDVSSMSDARLAELAAESEEVRQYRVQLQEDITMLKKGLEQCRRYKPRAVIDSKADASPGATRPEAKSPKGNSSSTGKPATTTTNDPPVNLFAKVAGEKAGSVPISHASQAMSSTSPASAKTSAPESTAGSKTAKPKSIFDFTPFPDAGSKTTGSGGIFGSSPGSTSSPSAGSKTTGSGGLFGGTGSLASTSSPSAGSKTTGSGGIFGSSPGSTSSPSAGSKTTGSGGPFASSLASASLPSAGSKTTGSGSLFGGGVVSSASSAVPASSAAQSQGVFGFRP